LKGGEISLAFTKKEKQDLISEYEKWLKENQAVFVLSYNKMSMKEISTLRAEARQNSAELHVVKNTLMNLALKQAGLENKGYFDGSSLVGFTQSDAPVFAKILQKASKSGEMFAIKGGYLDGKVLDKRQVIMLADLPSMPVMRATLLALLNTPASKLVRTLAEPARQIAAVLKAQSEKSSAPAVS
jgi:large subunit ribosomal protein L10